MKGLQIHKRQEDKINTDHQWAELFVELLNRQGSDYKVTDAKQISGWADIDAQAESISGKYEPLCIQFVRDFKYEGNLHKAKFFSGGNNEVMGHIRNKYDRYVQQKAYFGKHTLVVQVLSIIEGDCEHRYTEKMRAECTTYGFKAIYLLSPRSHGLNDQLPAMLCRLA